MAIPMVAHLYVAIASTVPRADCDAFIVCISYCTVDGGVAIGRRGAARDLSKWNVSYQKMCKKIGEDAKGSMHVTEEIRWVRVDVNGRPYLMKEGWDEVGTKGRH